MRLSPRRALLPLGLTIVACLGTPDVLLTQQFVTDDAAIVDVGACQLEGWIGESARWILPACQVVRGVELTAGLGAVVRNGGHAAQYVLQMKHIVHELAPGAAAVGLVAGVGFDRASQVIGGRETTVFAYVPVSGASVGERAVVHANAGWRHALREHEQAFTWALRGDLVVPGTGERVVAIGEMFGDGPGGPAYQVGTRISIVPDLLLVDVSWGGHTDRAQRGPGWAIGVAWTP